MQHSESFAQVAAALAIAQGAFGAIKRERTVKVDLRDKQTRAVIGSYTFSYAPLDVIIDATRPALSANGLAMVQAVMVEPTAAGGEVEVLRTTLVHSSGEWLACDVPMFIGTGDNKSQAYNSGATYARRAGVTMLLCIAAEEDDDGNGGDQDKVRPDYERSQVARQPPAKQGPRTPQARQQPAAAQAGAVAAAEASGPPIGFGDLEDAELFKVDPAAGKAAPGSVDGDGVPTSPWGADLTQGQIALASAKATAAGLTDAQLIEKYGVIDASSYSRVKRELADLAG